MSLRVISGAAKGRRLKSVPGDSTRPVTDRVKEALFDILAGDVQGSRWWDVFAGTGAIGIEALSRAASFARFTDLQRAAIKTIEWNVAHCGFQAMSEIRRADSFELLGKSPDNNFDYLYVAPPQYKGLWSRALEALDGSPGWLAADAWVVVQIDPSEHRPVKYQNLEEFDQRRYGKTLLIFYAKKA